MSDNHHYEYATSAFMAANANAASEFNAECREDAMIQSNLAIAYEQRTANLLAARVALHNRRENRKAFEVMEVVNERLGLK